MLKRMLAAGLTVTLAAWIVSGCSGGSSNPPPPPVSRGALFTFIGDAPSCNVLAFRPTITKFTLTLQSSGVEVPVIRATPSVAPTIKVNLASLRDFSTIFNLASLPVGTYDAATITLSVPQLAVFNPTVSPPIELLPAKLTTSAPKVSFQPALQITKGMVSALRLDFDLLQSIQVDALGQVTGNVTPTVHVIPFSAPQSQGFGEMDGIEGFVQRVDTFSANPKFIGDVQVQLLSGTGLSILINLTSTTQLVGAAALNQVPTGSFVEVNGYVDMNGNVVANAIDVQDREIVEQNKLAFIGIVTSAAKDANGNVTQFDLYVGETEPDESFSVPLDSVVSVNVSSSTGFQFSSPATNLPNLPVDATALTVGQEVVVHGTFTKPPAPPPPAPPPLTTVAADKVFLNLQTVQGNFSSLLQTSPDDKTGAFQLAACSSIFQGTPILVITDSQTAFVNVSGLSALTSQRILLVRGWPFFDRQGTPVNGVAVPAGSIVILAKEVHQLT